MNKEELEQIDKKGIESKLFMMLISSILLIFITVFIFISTKQIKTNFTFKFPINTIFIHTKGIQEYSIDRIKEKLLFLLSATTEKELNYFIEKVIDVKHIKEVKPALIKFITKEELVTRYTKILNVTKIYGNFLEYNGNNKIYKESNANYSISILSQSLKSQIDKKYITFNVIVNDKQEIISFKYYVNNGLKEFYEAVKVAKLLNLTTLPNYTSEKMKNKIAVRNLFIKPTGTYYKLDKVEFNKNQVRIIVFIDKYKYALIYKNGEIINVIKIKQ